MKLVIVIMSITYFVGIVWIIYCELNVSEFDEHGGDDNFIDANDIDSSHTSRFYNALQMMYFAFTSLSTVGFGDLRPYSDAERILCAFILLFGVAIFSIVMGNFKDILEEIKMMNADLDDSENLSKFLEVMAKFNQNKPIKEKFKNQITEFFDYKWKNDRNMAIDDDNEKAMVE